MLLLQRTVSQSTATVTVLTTINGVTKMQIEHRQDTYNQQKIILGPYISLYFRHRCNSGTGSGGIVSIAI
jgi:hypothetical protein